MTTVLQPLMILVGGVRMTRLTSTSIREARIEVYKCTGGCSVPLTLSNSGSCPFVRYLTFCSVPSLWCLPWTMCCTILGAGAKGISFPGHNRCLILPHVGCCISIASLFFFLKTQFFPPMSHGCAFQCLIADHQQVAILRCLLATYAHIFKAFAVAPGLNCTY